MDVQCQQNPSSITTEYNQHNSKEQMPPSATLESDSGDLGIPLLELASAEIENMRNRKDGSGYHSFPPACLSMLKNLEGNHRCIDCREHNPQWAAVRYGALLCLNCSGHHRSMGVQVSTVRSITMDEWSLEEVISMLEGGNAQLSGFFSRHALTEDAVVTKKSNCVITRDNVMRLRYKTKAALFYRRQMELHVSKVLDAGPYRGREISRRLKHHPLEKRNSTVE
jgi:hypothetical protein